MGGDDWIGIVEQADQRPACDVGLALRQCVDRPFAHECGRVLQRFGG